MPRNVRNFWISCEVDGKKAPIATGPRRTDGGFFLNIKMRDAGNISDKAINIQGRSFQDENGKTMLELEIFEDHEIIYTIYHER